MATLIPPHQKEKVLLYSHHSFGRKKESVETHIQSKYASSLHGVVRWSGSHWIFQDKSKNGTWINGDRLCGKEKILKEGDSIHFGHPEESPWIIESLTPPIPVLVAVEENLPLIELKDFVGLPSDENPIATLYRSTEGQWIYESESEIKTVADRDLITVENTVFRLFDAEIVELTHGAEDTIYPDTTEPLFQFNVSLDEEHVFLNIQKGEETLNLGERAHHYLLLTLARKKLEDLKAGTDSASQGWIDVEQLSELLAQDTGHLNIQIFRARKQVAKVVSGHQEIPPIVERRVGSVRFGARKYKILRGSTEEGFYEQFS